MSNKYQTQHAKKRMQQRAISELQVRLIETFGEYKYQKGGTYYAYIPEKELIKIRAAIDKLSKTSAVFGESDKLITVMHETHRTRHTQYSA